TIDFKQLEKSLGVPVIGANATRGTGLKELMETIDKNKKSRGESKKVSIQYTNDIEQAIAMVEPIVAEKLGKNLNARWISLKLLECDQTLINALHEYVGCSITEDPMISHAIEQARDYLKNRGVSQSQLKD